MHPLFREARVVSRFFHEVLIAKLHNMAQANEICCFDEKSASHPDAFILISLLLDTSVSSVKMMEKPEAYFARIVC